MQVKCTSCGASQNINEAQNCDFCGNLIELESAKNNYQSFLNGESGNLMSMAETAIEATNYEEALQFFNQVLIKDITNSDAWLGKGIAIVYTSKIGDIKTTEAIAYWKNAIKHAENQDAMQKRVAKEINEVVNEFYPAIENHYANFHNLDNAYQELVSRFATLESAQDFATKLDNKNVVYFETGLTLCNRVIDLPKKYANAASSSALAEGIAGQFSSNKYSREYAAKDAGNKVKKASARKSEIDKYAKVIDQISEKYFLQLKSINPNNQFVLEKIKYIEQEIKIKERIAHSEKYGGYYFLGLLAGPIAFMCIAVLLSYMIKISKDVVGVLFVISVFVGVIVGLYVADYIVKRKSK